MIQIAGLMFRRLTPFDQWWCEDKQYMLMLIIDTPSRPWRIAVDGVWRKSKFSTPYVAVMRTLEMGRKIDET